MNSYTSKQGLKTFFVLIVVITGILGATRLIPQGLRYAGLANRSNPPEMVTAEANSDKVTISWHTTKPSYGQLLYGTSSQLNEQTETSDKREQHMVEISGLAPDTIYYFKIISDGVIYGREKCLEVNQNNPTSCPPHKFKTKPRAENLYVYP